jgi:hypothetical protein
VEYGPVTVAVVEVVSVPPPK